MSARIHKPVTLVVVVVILLPFVWFVSEFGMVTGPWWLLGTCVYTLVTFGIFYWLRNRLNVRTALLYFVLWAAVGATFEGFISNVVFSSSGDVWLFWDLWDLSRGLFWGIRIGTFPLYPGQASLNLLLAVAITSAAYNLAKDKPDGEAGATQAYSSQLSYIPPTTDPATSSATYRLAASLLVNAELRNHIMGMVEQERKALAPELGIDFARLVRLCSLLRARDQKYDSYYLLATLFASPFFYYLLNSSSLESPVDFLVLAIAVLPGILIYFYYRYEVKANYAPLLVGETPDINKLETKLRAIYKPEPVGKRLPGPDQNVIVYSGFFPYVGAGIPVGGWTVLIDASRPRTGLNETNSFSPADVYAAIERQVQRTGFLARID